MKWRFHAFHADLKSFMTAGEKLYFFELELAAFIKLANHLLNSTLLCGKLNPLLLLLLGNVLILRKVGSGSRESLDVIHQLCSASIFPGFRF